MALFERVAETVDIVDDLTKTSVADGQRVELLGYSAAGDGGGQELYYDSSSTADIDGGLVFPGAGGTLSFDPTTGDFNGVAGAGRFVAVDQSVADSDRFGLIKDGSAPTWGEWSRFIKAAPIKKVLKPGTYDIDKGLSHTLTGPFEMEATGATIIDNVDNTGWLLTVSGGAEVANTTLQVGANRGDRTISVVSAAGLAAGQLVRILSSERFDLGGTKDTIEWNRITGVSGTDVTLDRPLQCTVTNSGSQAVSGNDVRVHAYSAMEGFKWNGGTIKQVNGTNSYGLAVQYCAKPTIKKVTTEGPNRYGIRYLGTFEDLTESCVFNDQGSNINYDDDYGNAGPEYGYGLGHTNCVGSMVVSCRASTGWHAFDAADGCTSVDYFNCHVSDCMYGFSTHQSCIEANYYNCTVSGRHGYTHRARYIRVDGGKVNHTSLSGISYSNDCWDFTAHNVEFAGPADGSNVSSIRTATGGSFGTFKQVAKVTHCQFPTAQNFEMRVNSTNGEILFADNRVTMTPDSTQLLFEANLLELYDNTFENLNNNSCSTYATTVKARRNEWRGTRQGGNSNAVPLALNRSNCEAWITDNIFDIVLIQNIRITQTGIVIKEFDRNKFLKGVDNPSFASIIGYEAPGESVEIESFTENTIGDSRCHLLTDGVNVKRLQNNKPVPNQRGDRVAIGLSADNSVTAAFLQDEDHWTHWDSVPRVRRGLSGGSSDMVWDYSQTHGTSWKMNGTDHAFRGGAPLLPATGDFTISCWVWRDVDDATNAAICAQRSTADTLAERFTFLIGTDDKLMFYIDNSNSAGNLVVPRGEWVHVALRREGSTFNSFVNGVFSESRTSSTPIQQQEMNIGAQPNGSNPVGAPYFSHLKGNMSDLVIRNRALTDAEITQLAANPYQWWIAPDTKEIQFDNVAALSSTTETLEDGRAYALKGYNEPGDGGGGPLIYYSSGRSDITLDDGISWAGPGADDYFVRQNTETLTPQMFGAKADLQFADLNVTSGSTTVTGPADTFSDADVGKTIIIGGWITVGDGTLPGSATLECKFRAPYTCSGVSGFKKTASGNLGTAGDWQPEAGLGMTKDSRNLTGAGIGAGDEYARYKLPSFKATIASVTNDTTAVLSAACDFTGSEVPSKFGTLNFAAFKRMIDGRANANFLIPEDSKFLIEAGAFGDEANRLDFSSGVTLRSKGECHATATAGQNGLWRMSNISDVEIHGGKYVGDRYTRLTTNYEQSQCWYMQQSRNISFKNVEITESHGDGISVVKFNNNENMTFQNVKISRVQRNGISATGGRQVHFIDCEISETIGGSPEAGFEVEPNQPNGISGFRVTRCKAYDNGSRGFLVQSGAAGREFANLRIIRVTQEAEAYCECPNHDFTLGSVIEFVDVTGMTELNGNRYTVQKPTRNGFYLGDLSEDPIDSTLFGEFTGASHVKSVDLGIDDPNENALQAKAAAYAVELEECQAFHNAIDMQVRRCADVRVHGARLSGLLVEYCNDIHVEQVKLLRGRLYVQGTSNAVFDSVRSYLYKSETQSPLSFRDGEDQTTPTEYLTVQNCYAYKPAWRGLNIARVRHSTFSNNTIIQSGHGGIQLDQSVNNYFLNNRILGCGTAAGSTYYGVLVGNANAYNTFRGNIIRYSHRFTHGTFTAVGENVGDGSGRLQARISTKWARPAAQANYYDGYICEVVGGTNAAAIGNTATIEEYAGIWSPGGGRSNFSFLVSDWSDPANPPDETNTFIFRQAAIRTYRGVRLVDGCANNIFVDNDFRFAGTSLNFWNQAGSDNTGMDNLGASPFGTETEASPRRVSVSDPTIQ